MVLIGRISNENSFRIFAPKANRFSACVESTVERKRERENGSMKSSKGKMPVGGKTKRLAAATGQASQRKQKEKDPVEVR